VTETAEQQRARLAYEIAAGALVLQILFWAFVIGDTL
jgi:hypothetical protein